ncbi:MAG: hypothetical protein OEP52_11455 [Acidimicrobiia bacterium]|nr:hypothetical protein [Acidimicrobiia bacterium]
MPDTSPERAAAHRPGKALYLSLGLGLLWIFLALNRPDTTYHFGAPLVAVAVSFSHRSTGSGPLSNPAAAGAAVSGLFNALFAIGILALNDSLRGGSLLPFGDATVEALLFAVGGAIVGFVIGIWGRPRQSGE